MKTRNIGRKTDSKTNFAPVCMGRKLNAAFNVNNRGEFSCEQDLDSFQMSESSVTSCELFVLPGTRMESCRPVHDNKKFSQKCHHFKRKVETCKHQVLLQIQGFDQETLCSSDSS